ncbi:hypothetical protein BDA99DRAFT_110929 [Phascolomyces articulosus]|uniref:Cora-domain-containing protein n=1 Tax=Phascolomyces articulosus TaxID=60185 RepID=A0AAD5K6E9_9FUNG|nr:hypothetical protein BDA99DRAFT_110929 [Phascolomyces articulosus]
MGRSRRSKRTHQRHSPHEQHNQYHRQHNGDATPPNGHTERQGSAFAPLNIFFNRGRNYSSNGEDRGIIYSTSPEETDHLLQHDGLTIDMQHPAVSTNGGAYATSEDSADDSSRHDEEDATALEEDVCFPNDKKVNEEGIDYYELDNYVREQKSGHYLDLPLHTTVSTPSQSHPPITQQQGRQRRSTTIRRYSLYGDRDRYATSEKIGQKEGRVTFFSVKEPHSIHAKSLDDIPNHAIDNDRYLQLSDLLKKGCFWLDILDPTDAEMKVLSKTFHIHPLTVEDISMEEQREKCEVYKNYYFICFRSFEQNQASVNYLQPLALYIIVLKEGVLTFHFRPTPHPHNVRKRIRQLRDYISVTPDWICYGLLDDITDSFAPLVRSIEFEVDSIDELVLILKESEQSDMLRRIGYCRKKMMGMMRLLSGKVDVVKTLVKRGEMMHKASLSTLATAPATINNNNEEVTSQQPVLSSEVSLYLGDVQDHIISMLQSLTHYEKISSRSHSNYLAQISIEMTQTNNEMNDVLSKLTALGSILVPMNLVTGLWGMNVLVPGQMQEDLTWFMSILFAITLFCITSTILMRYYRLV